MPDYRLLLAGDVAVVVEFGNRADLELSAKVLALARRLDQLRIIGVTETVPTIRSLLVHYEPTVISLAVLEARILEAMQDLPRAEQSGRMWQLPVCYDPAIAPDLELVADKVGLSATQVVDRHCGAPYHVYMLGFLPGLAYMGDVSSELAMPRRESPRAMIPAGSLGIAGQMTCIYPMDTPCGWHLIGRSPVQLWDAKRQGSTLLSAGDQVTFEPVSLREYERLRGRAKEGILHVAPSQ
jgi:inhibitor of KinA